MKAFFLTGSIIFLILTLILAFENMAAQCSGMLFIFFPMTSPFLMILMTVGVGFALGAFFTGFLVAAINKRPEDEEAPGGDW